MIRSRPSAAPSFSPFDRSIDVHVSNLRKKLGAAEGRDRIKTVRGTGYLFAEDER